MSDDRASATAAPRGSAGAPSAPGRLGRRLLLSGTPLLLGAALLFHPHGGGDDLYGALAPVVDTWLLLHVLLLPLFGLLGVCLYVLSRGYSRPVAATARIGIAVYLVSYVAFEAIAGIATGLLVREARTLPPAQREGVAAAVGAISEPIVALALVGTLGAVVAVASIAVLLRRSGAPLGAVVLLGGVPLTVFAHGGTPVDALGMALFLAGVVWLEFGWRGADGRRAASTA